MRRIGGWQISAVLLCFLFGLLITFQTMGAGEGVWFWYDRLFLGGKRLYADLHLVQQPLFVLETALFMKLFGASWLASRALGVLHLIVYCLAMALLMRESDLSDSQKSLLFACSFSIAISFGAYSFCDYHAPTGCFVMYSAIVLLGLSRASTDGRRVFLVSILGLLSALAVTTRLNDGAALFIAIVFAILGLVSRPLSVLLVVLFFSVFGAAVLVVVRLTGDTLHDYLNYSLFRAAGTKGGFLQVFLEPLRMPVEAMRWLSGNWNPPVLFEACGVALVWTFLRSYSSGSRNRWLLATGLLGFVLVLVFVRHSIAMLFSFSLLNDLSGFVAIMIIPFGLWMIARFSWRHFRSDTEASAAGCEILFLIPIGALASGAMSAGGSYVNLGQGFAMLMLLMPVCSSVRFKGEWPRNYLYAFMVLLLISTASRRAARPYYWHSYVEKPLFVDRIWYHHPQCGPMLLNRDLLEFIQPVCRHIGQDGPADELLSLPFPFANYFCATPPWRGYVQTFYDTTSSETIAGLERELQNSPPKWIFYQRQLFNLRMHENVYNHGMPLPQRDLDRFILQKLSSREWHVVYTSEYGDAPPVDNRWYLIATDRRSPGQQPSQGQGERP